jgi:uncharacterized protein with GYD domain
MKNTPKVGSVSNFWGAVQTVKDIYWTLGAYDGVSLFEAPNDEAIAALGLAVGALGSVRTQIMRAFSLDEMNGVLGKLP